MAYFVQATKTKTKRASDHITFNHSVWTMSLEVMFSQVKLKTRKMSTIYLGFYAESRNQVKSLRYCKILPGENVLR